MRSFVLLLVALIMSVGLVFSTASAKEANELSKSDKEKTYLVGFKNFEEGHKKAKNSGEVKRKYKHLPFIAVKMTPGKAKALENDPDILFVEPDGSVEIKETYPWNLSRIKADVAQSQTFTGQGIKIAVLDTGVDNAHEDLNIAGGAYFTEGSGSNLDDNGHGTHVAGIIAALANGKGTIGVAPNAGMYVIKVLDKNGLGSYSQVIEAIDWAIENKMNIVCMSFGGDQPSQALEQTMQTAYDNGILLVAAAGNSSTIQYPAKFPSVIAVGAVDQENLKAPFSATGPELELVAPGVGIESTLPGNNYGAKTGTSEAAPHVAGAAALVWSAQPGLTNIQVRDLMKQTAQPLGDATQYGSGLVDAAGALAIQQPQADYFPPDKVEIIKINGSLVEDPNKGRTVSVQCLLSADPEVRGYAAKVLAEFGQGDDLDYLYKVMENDSQDSIRGQAALSVAKIEMRNTQDEDQKLSLLAVQLNSLYPQVRDFAVYQLSELNSEGAKTLAGEALAQETDPARASVLESINQSSGTSAVSALSFQDDLDDGLIKLLSTNKIGDGQTITAGDSATVSCRISSSHSRVEIRVYKNSNPSNTIASRTIYNVSAYSTVSYTWNSSSSASSGTYTIVFHYPDNGSSAYDDYFTIYVEEDDTTPPPPSTNDPYETNDSRSQATSIQIGRTYSAYIGSSSDKDYFKLVPNGSGTLDFSLNVPSSVDYDVDFMDSSGNILTGSYRGTGSDESFTYNVTGGNTYYIKIYSFGGYSSSSYSFTTSLQSGGIKDPYEPNNSLSNATSIELNRSYTAYIDYDGDDDYYRFVPGVSGKLSLNMTVPSDVDYDVRLLNSSGSGLKGSYNGTGSSESFTYDVTGGSTYYIYIYGYDGDYNSSQSYQFSTTLTPTKATLGLSVSAPGQVKSGETFTVTATVSIPRVLPPVV